MEVYRKRLEKKHIKQSMSRRGNCYDNAVIENFFGILKTEFFYLQKFNSINHFEEELEKYISYYNNKRIKLKFNGLSPMQYKVKSIVNNIKISPTFGVHFKALWMLMYFF